MRERIAPAAVAALAFLLALAPAAPAAAQLDVELRVSPQAGVLTPAEWLYYEVTVFGEGPMEWTESAVLRSTVVGITAEARLEALGVWLRGSVLRTLDTDTYVVFATMNAGPLTPAYIERTRYDVPTSLTLASFDVVLPTRLRLPFDVQPYVTGGIGGKHYTFDRGPLDGGHRRLVHPEDGTTLMASFGGGVTARVGDRVGIDLQVRDTVSRYWNSQQHDVLWTAGLSWELF